MADAFRWTHEKPLSRPDKQVAQGDVFVPTDGERHAFRDRIEPAPDVEPDADADVETPIDPAEYSTRELRDHLADASYSDEQLQAIADAERDGKDRSTAVSAAQP